MSPVRDDSDIEQLLRDAFTGRAASVDHGPAWRPPHTAEAEHRRRRAARLRHKAVLMPLAAAAAVLAVALAISSTGSAHRQQPATVAPMASHTRTATSSASPSPSATTPAVTAAVCRTSLPEPWQTALASGTTTAGGASAVPLSVSADGEVLISRDFGSSRDVALLSPGGSAQSIYTVPEPDENQVTDGLVEGYRALVVVSRLPRDANGVLETVVRVVVVDLRSGTQTVVATNSLGEISRGGRTIDGATLYRGHVYYDVRQNYTSRRSAVHDYDIATGSDHVVAHAAGGGPGSGPALAPFGVVWSRQTMQVGVSRPLPGPVARAMSADGARASLVTDGTAYAWNRTGRQVGYWTAGMTVPDYFDPRSEGGVESLVGAFVVLSGGSGAAQSSLLDARTAAIAPLPGIQPYSMGSGSVLASYALGGSKENTAVVALDTAHLPDLRC